MKRSLIFISAIVCFNLFTNGQVINIPADFSTIQEGIETATDGDTVIGAEGTFYENINFIGKAITVASRFILDGDTAHISKTIIDGSQFSYRNLSSTVTMCSGEDTTSVLMGFTITGGGGTTYFDSTLDDGDGYYRRGGGGVFILGSGGKILHNIIEGNQGPGNLSGGGVHVHTFNNHTVIIRKNIIRHNYANICGGGISTIGGGMLCEENLITNNQMP